MPIKTPIQYPAIGKKITTARRSCKQFSEEIFSLHIRFRLRLVRFPGNFILTNWASVFTISTNEEYLTWTMILIRTNVISGAVNVDILRRRPGIASRRRGAKPAQHPDAVPRSHLAKSNDYFSLVPRIPAAAPRSGPGHGTS